MIEIIYKEENKETQGEEAMFCIPRNIRQIGLIRDDFKIYMEDYVYTFLVRLSRAENENEGPKARVAVLTGETKWWSGTTYLFVKGALMVNDMEAAEDHVDFTDEIWVKIHAEQEKYFADQEIVGWFFSQPQLSLEITELFARVHLKHFGGEKILMLMEPLEKEDAFFRYENSFMARQSGYYIYYEKNPLMQAYMIEKNGELQPDLTEKYEDDAVKSFRKIIKGKKEETEEEHASVFSYAATACLAIAVLVVGVNFYRNYQNMNRLEDETQMVSSVLVEKVTPVPSVSVGENVSKNSMNSGKTEPSSGTQSKENGENTKIDQSATQQDGGALEGIQENQAAVQQDGENQAISGESQTVAQQEGDVQAASDESQSVMKQDGDIQDTSDANRIASSEDVSETSAANIYQEESDVRKAKRRAALEGAEKENQEAASENVHETYVIKPGDTLFQISMARYGSMDEIQEICELNNMSAEEIIYPGQIIVLP